MKGGFITKNARLRKLASGGETHFVPSFGNLIRRLSDLFDMVLKPL